MQTSTNRKVLILKKPHITEKASILSASAAPAYVFQIDRETNKQEVLKAIKETYKVNPVRINVINLPAKQVFSRGKWGMKSGLRKAVVYLKKGDKIDIV